MISEYIREDTVKDSFGDCAILFFSFLFEYTHKTALFYGFCDFEGISQNNTTTTVTTPSQDNQPNSSYRAL
ncbi:uncharacterized protein CANTADRAFT_24493, partial [Suhomyces tanzawaensis NRRL Y-17324]